MVTQPPLFFVTLSLGRLSHVNPVFHGLGEIIIVIMVCTMTLSVTLELLSFRSGYSQ